MNITVEKIIYPGKSLARNQGKIVLTDEGLPGEEVEALLTKGKKNYIEAKTTRIYKPSSYRVVPRCNHYRVCSAYQYITYPFQTEIKKRQIIEMLLHQLKIEPSNISFRPSAHIWNYRNKIRLRIIWENAKPHLAYHIPKTQNEFVKINECFLVSIQINEVLKLLLELIDFHKANIINEVLVRENSDKNQLLLAFYCDDTKKIDVLSDVAKEIKKVFPLKGAVCLNKQTSQENVVWGKDSIEENINGSSFRIGAESFFQVNSPLFKYLIQDIEETLAFKRNETIADLYCGVGTFGILFSSKVAMVWGVELSKTNISYFVAEVKSNRLIQFYHPVKRRHCFIKQDELVKLIRSYYPHKLKPVVVSHPNGYRRSFLCYSFKSELKDCSVKVRVVVVFGKFSDEDSRSIHLLITNDLNAYTHTIVAKYTLRWGIERTFKELKDVFCFDQYQLRHKKQIQRYWILCFIAWSLVYWIRQNGYLNKTLSGRLESFNDYKKALNSLLFLGSGMSISKNKELICNLYGLKSHRMRKNLGLAA